MARTMEIAERQSKATGNNELQNHDNVNKLRFTPRNRSTQSRYMSRAKSQSGPQDRRPKFNSVCRNCAGKYRHESLALLKEKNIDIAINLITSKLCAKN
ncbi:hypothetical protein DPMN_043011 [Dreissena polymorpha]|uniref:Uncharacterized protein n=1 Tax=Dreissena polymorpha TaxID=45954 RepID=A0A9D4HXJ6_DREPO|nr:hypothetical protein DPMN_043011 [Dreissena polymorpha]